MTNIQTEPIHIHHIPVTDDDERPLLAITQDKIDCDAVVLYPIGDDHAAGLERYQRVLGELCGLSVTVTDPIHTADALYPEAYRRLRDALDANDAVYVNPAGLSTRLAHLLTTAAQTLALERPADRDLIDAYTVDGTEEPRALPLAPDGGPTTETERAILATLADGLEPGSISELARALADGECPSAFRSKVQYNAHNLEEKGYLERAGGGHALRPRLTPMGRLWAAATDLETEVLELNATV